MADLVDIDLDALAPKPKRVKLGGKLYWLPGDMPLPLFFKLQAFGERVERGESEITMLEELHSELLELFQARQPTMKSLPDLGVSALLQALGAIYGGGPSPGEAPAVRTARSKKRTPSKPSRRTRPATSR